MSEQLVLKRGFVLERTEVDMKVVRLPSEAEVLERVKKGDREAYQVIVVKYMKRAYYICLSFVHNSEDALDISQEAFIRAFRKINRFDTKKPFFPWFYILMRNLCLDYLKRSSQRAEIPLEEAKILKTEKNDREMKEILWKGIESLPTEQKEVILLRYFQQFSYQEIAEILDKPLGTVMSSLYYAKRHLKKNIEKYLNLE
jgi:RNA polymerase sigma-70 factor (ECF subfamily)